MNEDADDVFQKAGIPEEELPVRISYEIIHLFSEGLYRSPHKAIEELVSNSYDAGATEVRVLLPRDDDVEPLWVVDNGDGMDKTGFRELWQIARSPKAGKDHQPSRGRPPIGQFGIGKLAAYVLAWRITHLSKSIDGYLLTSMNFRTVDALHQWETADPVKLTLRRVEEAEAKQLLGDLAQRDESSWGTLFGKNAAPTWTAAGLSDFKPLAAKLRRGTLAWVLRTGLPRTADFRLFLDGELLESTKIDLVPLEVFRVGGTDDNEADMMGLTTTATGVLIPGLQGEITGSGRVFQKPLAGGKSDQYNRSYGFFICVRGRVINLDDELFGLTAQNHAAWARFEMTIDADGLRDFLQSSREGVRDNAAVSTLREYLQKKFLAARRAYDKWLTTQIVGDEIYRLINEVPPSLVREPLLTALRREIVDPEQRLYYIRAPQDLGTDDASAWIDAYEAAIQVKLFESIDLKAGDRYSPIGSYDAGTRSLTINQDHPFVALLLASSRNPTPAKLFATAEVLGDALLRQGGISDEAANEFLSSRDRVLRALVHDYPHTAADVIGLLAVGETDDAAMEGAVGAAFQVLGLEYERRGGNRGGPDGVLLARLGVQGASLEDFKLVFDAKTTTATSISSDKVNFSSVKRFQREESANFGFVVGKKFDGQFDETSAINQGASHERITVLLTEDIKRILELHLAYGLPLSKLRDLFDTSCTIVESHAWVERTARDLADPTALVPLRSLLEAVQSLKRDGNTPPTIAAARQITPSLLPFSVAKLQAVLQGLVAIVGRKWIEVDSTGNVYLQQSPELLVAEAHRALDEWGLGGGPIE